MASNAHSQTGPKGITVDRIKEALRKNGGVVLHAARALECSPQNLRQRIAGDKELLEYSATLAEDVLDLAEGVIVHALRKKDATTARWLLDRKGKSRGIVSTTEITGPNGGAIQHAVTTTAIEPTTPEEIAAARRRYFNDSDD